MDRQIVEVDVHAHLFVDQFNGESSLTRQPSPSPNPQG